ncbi:hypothetical protein A3F37_00770 [Candidatus Saccharibacteria bacterium RIFCSPHIGHO2_12_FULL_41_12]|nr:MAG: hypothetical protein A3F37_00770 [Candidatus Saccharibacteria bacterium RIFCSPHIGHO2_12_FULL_41_12]
MRTISKKTKLILIPTSLLLITVGTLLVLEKIDVIDLPFVGKTAPPPVQGGINYGPPTEQEKKETEQFKEKQAAENRNSTITESTPGQIKPVTPIISSWGQNPQTKDVRVVGFVPGIYEAGGICTFTMQNNAKKVTKTTTASKDAQTTSCGAVTFPYGELSAGTWNITLNYSSASSTGNSTQSVSLGVQ